MQNQHTPVIIVGAGPAGLTAAAQLASMGVRCAVLERRDGSSILPRATAISVRSMEIFRSFGLQEKMVDGSVPVTPFGRIAPALLTPAEEVIPVGYPTDKEALEASPEQARWIPQDHIEPVLRNMLHDDPLVDVRYYAEVTDVELPDDGVRVTVRDSRTGEETTRTADYVIAGDGAHSIIRRCAGIPMVRDDRLGTFDLVIFRAPVRIVEGETLHGLNVITNPDYYGWLAPSGSGDRWLAGIAVKEGATSLRDRPEEVAGALRTTIGDPDLDPKVEMVGQFTFAAMLADRYRQGRAFLIGDAAHRMTPRGGMGLNTAIHDGYDLAWRLAWVVHGWADDHLLDGYEAVRRPVGKWNVDRSTGSSRLETTEGFARDLAGRIAHAWVDGGLSTLDLLGQGLTVLVAGDTRVWCEAAEGQARPVDGVGVAADIAEKLGLEQGQAVVVRPDAKPVWRGVVDSVADAVLRLQEVTDAGYPHLREDMRYVN